MRAILDAEVELWVFSVFSEIAVWEKRPDLQILCTTIRDRGCLDDEAIDAVLPGLSTRARRNLARHLGYLQLVNRNGDLTVFGRRCAAAGDSPSWEQGVYKLLVASHPLFGCHVLDFKRTPGDGFDRDYDSLEPVPAWLAPERRRIFTSSFEESRRFSIGEFLSAQGSNAACRATEMPPGKLRWEIDLVTGANQWTIEGDVGTAAEPQPFRSAPESVEPGELAGLFRDWEPRWDDRKGRVAMTYDGSVGPDGRESFKRTIKYGRVRVGRFGTFEEAAVLDVPVGPATADDARNWATAIVVSRIETAAAFVAPERWRAEWSAAVDGTPLEGVAGSVPDAASLSDVNGRTISPRTRWLLAAGVHVGMEA